MIGRAGLRIAALIKQVPRFEEMTLGPDGRLRRDGLDAEMSPYCRRAVSKGVELAAATGGRATVFTLGPHCAEDVLREAIAWGAHDGVLISDPAFAGSDTLATARALARALEREGPFDLILVGRNSTDADTGQVGPQVAEFLGVPFLGAVRELALEPGMARARGELDDGWLELDAALPAVLSCAERLCEPAKVNPEGRAAVPSDRIRRFTADDLGDGPWGQQGSPTSVGQVRVVETHRARHVLRGTVEQQVGDALHHLRETGALTYLSNDAVGGDRCGGAAVPAAATTALSTRSTIGVLLEPDRGGVTRELLGEAAVQAARIGARVVAIGPPEVLPGGDTAFQWGADRIIVLQGSMVGEDVAVAVAGWAQRERPWAVLTAGTMWGREVAARVAVRLGVGLTGDAVELDVDADRLVGWKPAFGGHLVAAITSTSDVQLVTLRPGCLDIRAPRPPQSPTPRTSLAVPARDRVHWTARGSDDDAEVLVRAPSVIGVGTGVEVGDYPQLQPLLDALGAELAATRKVTDRGWLPRSRQVGITGRSISPQLYVAVGLSGKFNHMVGVRRAGIVVAINRDPEALVFSAADIGIVGDWREVVAELARAVEGLSATDSHA